MSTIALLVAGAVAVAAFGGLSSLGGGGSGPLAWSEGDVSGHPTLPGDRVLTATLRNDSDQPLRVDIADVRLLDGDGGEVLSTPVFLESSGASLWEAEALEAAVQRGGTAVLRPGEEMPLTVAWHAKDGDPQRVDYGRGWLALPG